MKKRRIEIEVAETLLDIGVTLPLVTLKVPFSNRRISLIRIKMKRPYLGTLIRMSRVFRKIGVTYEEMEQFSASEEIAFMASHGEDVAKMVALGVCRGRLSGRLFSKPLSKILLWGCDDRYIFGACLMFKKFLGTRSFKSIIRLVERTNPMKPRLSHMERES